MSKERKIHNFPSIILEDHTLEKYGYTSDSLGKSSAKFIVAICRFCGKPHDIRKGFFTKSGSACHKECKTEELKLQNSPFSDPNVREKAKKTNIKRYGKESASSSDEIKNKISKTKKSQEHKKRVKNSVQELYGVNNVFQNESIKSKSRKTNIDKYGFPYAIQNDKVKNKVKETCIKKYGVENPMHDSLLKNKALDSYKKTIMENKDGKYDIINYLRSEEFWEMLSEDRATLSSVCDSLDLKYQTVASTLSRDEFKERFKEIYSFPRAQKQKELYEFVSELGINCNLSDRTIIKPYELDVYMPELNIAIEFNGSYWHSEAVLDKTNARKKHIAKTQMCNEAGIFLFHIFEANWDNKKEVYKSYIKNIVNKNDTKIPARKCELNYDFIPKFIEENHLQGSTQSPIQYFNLIFNGEIVASMSASRHPRRSKEKEISLSRFCCKQGVNVQGGASKMFKAFCEWSKKMNYDQIVSFSDNTYSNGDIYRILGFDLDTKYGPDYFYWDMTRNIYRSKQSQRKKATGCPQDVTEREWNLNRGLYRIWDCGKKRWIYNLQNI